MDIAGLAAILEGRNASGVARHYGRSFDKKIKIISH